MPNMRTYVSKSRFVITPVIFLSALWAVGRVAAQSTSPTFEELRVVTPSAGVNEKLWSCTNRSNLRTRLDCNALNDDGTVGARFLRLQRAPGTSSYSSVTLGDSAANGGILNVGTWDFNLFGSLA